MDVNSYLSPSSTSQPGMFIFFVEMAKPPDTSEKKSQQSLSSPGIFHGGQDPQLHKSLAGNGMVSPRSPHIPPVHFIYTLNLLEMTGNTQDNRLLCEQSYPGLSRAHDKENSCAYLGQLLLPNTLHVPLVDSKHVEPKNLEG